MAKYYRGDTFPVTASYEGYKFQAGDKVTGGIFDMENNKLAEVSMDIVGECDAVQLEFSREDMHDVLGECWVEVRTVTNADIEMTIRKKVKFEEDGLR